jgi:ornithine cyclodeaminase
MLNADAVAAYLQPHDVLTAVREAFVLHSEGKGRVFPVIREKLSTGGVFGIKAGDVQSEGLLGFKAAGFWPSNRNLGSEPHQATIMLIDPATGRPVCIIDGNAITTARTGAAGALGLQQLARRDSTQLCVFGTGVQARSQVDYALRVLPDIQYLRYVSVDRKRDESFESHFAGRLPVECAADADTAVARSDMIITATPGGGPLFSAEAVMPGTHLNCVGTDTKGKRELPEGLLPRVRLVADDLVQSRQIGESQWAPDTPCIEIGDLFTGKAKLERAQSDITLFDLTGLALQDLTVARLIHEKARASGKGIEIDWPW